MDDVYIVLGRGARVHTRHSRTCLYRHCVAIGVVPGFIQVDLVGTIKELTTTSQAGRFVYTVVKVSMHAALV